MTLEPLADYLVVRLEDAAPAEHSGIQVVRLEKQPQMRGTVEAIGPEVRDVSVGQRVLFSRLQGITVGNDRLILPESAVLATLEEGE